MREFWDNFFAGGWLVLVAFVLLGFMFYGIHSDNVKSEYCFERQMVKVATDFGSKCVKVDNLVNVP